MKREANLREIERRTYMSYHEDGLIDIFVGVYILLFSAGIFFETIVQSDMWFVIPGIFPAVMIPVWISVKRRITMPRIGFVKFRSGGASKLMGVFLGLLVAGFGVFMVFGFFSTQAWAITFRNLLISNGMIVIGVGAATISGIFGYIMGLKRLYIYGLLALVLFFSGQFIVIPLEYLLLTIGLVIVIYGFVLLLQFMRKYPLP